MCGWEPQRARMGDGDSENVSRRRLRAGVSLLLGGQIQGRSLGNRERVHWEYWPLGVTRSSRERRRAPGERPSPLSSQVRALQRAGALPGLSEHPLAGGLAKPHPGGDVFHGGCPVSGSCPHRPRLRTEPRGWEVAPGYPACTWPPHPHLALPRRGCVLLPHLGELFDLHPAPVCLGKEVGRVPLASAHPCPHPRSGSTTRFPKPHSAFFSLPEPSQTQAPHSRHAFTDAFTHSPAHSCHAQQGPTV